MVLSQQTEKAQVSFRDLNVNFQSREHEVIDREPVAAKGRSREANHIQRWRPFLDKERNSMTNIGHNRRFTFHIYVT